MKKNAGKRPAAIAKLAFDVIPQNPARPEYWQGATLGDEHKHWFRARFFQRCRLFFRYHALGRLIVFAWVHDEGAKRADSDAAYRVFRKMLERAILRTTGISCRPKREPRGGVSNGGNGPSKNVITNPLANAGKQLLD